ncbi:MAG: dihydrodipicolinate synthase family protein [Chloroflexota bacterium]
MTTAADPSPRHPRGILVACAVPWDDDDRFMEPLFREQVRGLVARGFPQQYVFGTAGEGHAVDTARFTAVTRAFVDEAAAAGASAMVGVIALSTPAVLERIAIARDLGARSFQISLPAWGRLADAEVDRFFDDVCGAHPDARFLHYNVGRSGRMLTGADYRRIADRHPNLVATKQATGSTAAILDILRGAPELAHHVDVDVFPAAALLGPVSLLASYAPLCPRQCHALLRAAEQGDAATLARLGADITALSADLWSTPAPGPHMDGAYDKLLLRVGLMPGFPLRLLSPYEGFTADDARRCRDLLETRWPDWLPD